MNVKNCRMCGRLFNYITGYQMCPMCKEEMEKKFQQTKEYINENRHVRMEQVAEACDVDIRQIRQWLREERLELTADSAIILSCELCGGAIRRGKYCDKCKQNMASNLGTLLRGQAPTAEIISEGRKKEARMRFLSDDKK